MTERVADRALSPKAVAAEQLRVAGLAVKKEAIAACVLLASAVLILVVVGPARIAIDGRTPVLDPTELGAFAAMLALVAPLGVWKGEKFFGDSQLWSMPVDHRLHALTKVAAGWVWLMGLISVGMLALWGLWMAGIVTVEETRLLINDPVGAASGEPGALQEVAWMPRPWQWLVPFTAATASYLAASAFLLSTRHPLRWLAGGWLFLLVFGMLGEEGPIDWVASAYDGLISSLEALVNGGNMSLREGVPLPSGDRVWAWATLPSLGRWVGSVALWTALAATGLVAAASRHRES